ncbi:MAG: lysostaphin resistance A-like protein [Flavobacteriales bacterium]
MSSFLTLGSSGTYTPAKVCLTLFMVLLAHTLGSLPLVFAIPKTIDPTNIQAVASYLGTTRFFIFQMIPFVAVALVLIGLQRWVFSKTTHELFTGRARIDTKRFVFAFFLWGSIMTLSVGVEFGLTPDKMHWNFQPMPWLKTALLLLFFLPFQVLAEELLFRGLILQQLHRLVPSAWFAILLSGTLFGLLHASNPEVMSHGYGLLFMYAFYGIFLSFLTVADNGLELAYGFHVANNFFQGILITSSDQAFQLNGMFKTHAMSFSWTSIVMLVVSLALFLGLCYKRYPWHFGAAFKNNE